MCKNEKAQQTFLPACTRMVHGKVIKVVILPVAYVENTCACRFPIDL